MNGSIRDQEKTSSALRRDEEEEKKKERKKRRNKSRRTQSRPRSGKETSTLHPAYLFELGWQHGVTE